MTSTASLVVEVVLLLLLLTSVINADYFTNPSDFITEGTNYLNVQTLDLADNFTLGEKVQVTWYSPALYGAYISLTVSRWDSVANGTDLTIKSLITNSYNLGYYTWTVGEFDGIDEGAIATSPNFFFHLTDVVGNRTSTGNPAGFIDHTLSSRGFVVLSKTKTASSISATSTAFCPSRTAQAVGAQSNCSQTLTKGAIAGIAVCAAGAAVAAIALAALAWVLYRQRKMLAQTPPAVVAKPNTSKRRSPHELPDAHMRHELENSWGECNLE